MESERVILFIDEVHTLVGGGKGSGDMDAADLLKPALARSRLQVIGATTVDEYRSQRSPLQGPHHISSTMCGRHGARNRAKPKPIPLLRFRLRPKSPAFRQKGGRGRGAGPPSPEDRTEKSSIDLMAPRGFSQCQ